MRTFKDTWVHVVPRPGACLGNVCEEASSIALHLHTMVELTFNDTTILVMPGMIAEVIFKQWNLARSRVNKPQFEWYDNYQNFMKGQEAVATKLKRRNK